MLKKKPKKLKIRLENKKIDEVKTVASKALRLSRGALDATAKFTERKKLLIMQIGVAGFMVIFFAAWIFSLKYQFKAETNNNNQNSFNWIETKAELDQAMNQVKQGIKEIKQIQAARSVNTLPRQPELTTEQLDLLKEKLMEETGGNDKE